MKQAFSALVLGVAILTACAGWQKPAGREERVREVSATVTAVDTADRLVGLDLENGEVLLLDADGAVKDLGQLRVGDDVIVAYRQTLIWRVRPAGKAAPEATAETIQSEPARADRPSVPARRRLTLTATITALDPEAGTVTLSGLHGDNRVLKSSRPDDLKRMQVGDLVDITYDEAVTVEAKPAGR
jgi:hypothetical protein